MSLFGFGKDGEEENVDVKTKASDTKKATQSTPKEKVEKKNDKKKAVAKKDDKKSAKAKKSNEGAADAYGVIIAPIMTEKSHSATDQRAYTFRVRKGVNKMQICKAVEGLYGVEVEGVRVLNMPQRRRTIGRNRGYQSGYKKALVTVKSGNKIDFFEGV